MSIDRDLDHYLEQRGITPSAEVVPDHVCQIFEQPAGPAGSAGEELADARQLVEKLLGESGGAREGRAGHNWGA